MIANLQEYPIKLKRFQKVAFMHLIPIGEVVYVNNFGELEEFGLPTATPLLAVHSLISYELLTGLTETQKDAAIALFENCHSIFC